MGGVVGTKYGQIWKQISKIRREESELCLLPF